MTTITNAGAVPDSPTVLLNEVIAAASVLSPGLTANLPASLIEDLASTATGAVVIQDQGVADLINSISPFTANPPLIYALGAQNGIIQGTSSNTSVYVTFLSTNYGFPINKGFVVSDGTNQYIVQDGGVIPTSGQSTALYCLAVNSGSFAVPVGTVTQIITSLPSGINVTCTNLTAGLPGQSAQTLESYQSQVIQAGQATAQGMPTFVKTLLQNVPGVQSNLISISAVGTNWKIIVGGGDPYNVANAIYLGFFDFSNLVGSAILAYSISNAYPAVVVTNLNHGYQTGQIVQFTSATGMSGINSIPFTAIVTDQKTFSLNVAIASITWASTGGGKVTVITATPHGIPSGTISGTIYGCTPSAYNGTFTLTQVNTTTFTYPLASNPGVSTKLGYTPFDSTTAGSYNSDTAIVTPNLRNVSVSINSYPDTYAIPFVNPPSQTVTVSLTWNTISPNYVSDVAVTAAGQPAITKYINGIEVGQPINLFDMQAAFQASVANLLQVSLISKMNFVVTINGVTTSPSAGTGVIYGDPESYFQTTNALITITQG